MVQSDLSNEGPDVGGAYVLERHVRARVIAVADHRLERGALGDEARELRGVEDRAVERLDAFVERKLGGREVAVDVWRVHLSQGFAQHVALERARAARRCIRIP